MLRLRLFGWVPPLFFMAWPSWPAPAPCDPDAGDDLQAPAERDDTENRAGLDRVWIGVTEKPKGKRWYDGTPPAHIEAFRPTGRRNWPRMESASCGGPPRPRRSGIKRPNVWTARRPERSPMSGLSAPRRAAALRMERPTEDRGYGRRRND